VPQPAAITAAEKLRTGAKYAAFGFAINVVFAVGKLIAGWVGHSGALIADGIESSLDIAGSAAMWMGLRFAARPPDDTHPYGHGKAEPFAAITVAVVVLSAATGLAIESVREINTPRVPPAPWTLAVLVAVIAIKETLFRTIMRVGERVQSHAIKSDAVHHRSDAITSIGAFVGISIALIGGPGYESADDWAALLACVWIAYNGIRMLVPAFLDLMDTAPPPELAAEIQSVAEKTAGVVEVEKCLVRKMGLQHYVDLHVHVDPQITVQAGHLIAHAVKDAVKDANPTVADVLVHVEPGREHAETPTARRSAGEDDIPSPEEVKSRRSDSGVISRGR
jgi:cation diffusion facilitator family transporter